MSYYAKSNDICISEEQVSNIANYLRESYKDEISKLDADVDDDFDLVFCLAKSYGFDLFFYGGGYELSFDYNKYRSDEVEEFLNLIARYIGKGNYIEFVGEDDARWAFYFTGKSVSEHYGYTIYDGMPIDSARVKGKTPWEYYCDYLIEWARTHRTEMHKGEFPACFDEFVDCELEDLNRGDD